MAETATVTPEDLRGQLAEIRGMIEKASVPATVTSLQGMEGKLLKQLNSFTKEERKTLETAITEQHSDTGLKYKVVSNEDYEKALEGKVTDPRAAAIMENLPDEVNLEQGEVVMIKKGSGVDKNASETLSEAFKEELASIGEGYVVVASRGSVGTGGTRGDLSTYPDGTMLTKTYNDVEFKAEITNNAAGERIIKGVEGDAIKNQEFNSLSGAASAITGYSVRGPEWWKMVTPTTNGAETTKAETKTKSNGNSKS